jgi:hypothetical protein
MMALTLQYNVEIIPFELASDNTASCLQRELIGVEESVALLARDSDRLML